MDIDTLITYLGINAPSFSTITKDAIDTSGADHAAALFALLSPVFSTRAYPLTLPEGATFPAAVYELASQHNQKIDGTDVATHAVYVVSVRTATFAELVTKVDAIKTAFGASTWAIEITDQNAGYDPQREHFRADLEVVLTASSFAPSAMPGLLVYHDSEQASPSSLDNCIRQRVTSNYGFVIATQDGDVATLRAELQAALLGYQQVTTDDDMQYLRGERAPSTEGLELWRDIFYNSYSIREA